MYTIFEKDEEVAVGGVVANTLSVRNALSPAKTLSPTEVSVLGNITEFKELHPLNREVFNVVNLVCFRFMLFKLLQLQKASLPIFVTKPF